MCRELLITCSSCYNSYLVIQPVLVRHSQTSGLLTWDNGGVVVQVSTNPGFDRIWDHDGSGPRFDSVQDSTFVTNVVSVSNT